eukprot:scaffold14.g1096.t1
MVTAAAALLLLTSGLHATAEAVAAVPWTFLAVMHALALTRSYRGWHPDSPSLNWLVGLLAGYGGGVVTAVLIMNPSAAPAGILSDKRLAIIYTLSWWAMHYFPGRLVERAFSLRPLLIFIQACRSAMRANIIFARVEVAARLFPGVLAAPLLLGTLAGAGGTLLVDAVEICGGHKKGPSEIARPGFPLRSALIASAAYYVLVHWAALLTAAEGRGLVLLVCVGHAVAAAAAGRQLDWTAPVARAFHAVTLIPEPGRVTAEAANGKSSPPRTPSPPPPHRSATDASLQEAAAAAELPEEEQRASAAPAQRTARRRAGARRRSPH